MSNGASVRIVVVIEYGESGAAISSVIETIDSIINRSLFLVAKGSPQGKIVTESVISTPALETC